MVEVHYIRYGKMNIDCNYLETTPEQRNELLELINNCSDIFKDSEVNIVKLGLLRGEMNDDMRIRDDILDKIQALGGGKALFSIELKAEYKNKKICYCTHDHEFNDTITTVFHELYHLNDPFNFEECVKKMEEIGDEVYFRGYLKYIIKAYLSEYHADYKAARYLLNQSKFKEIYMNKVKIHFNYIDRNAMNYNFTNQRLKRELITSNLVDKIFGYKFNERFFRIMAIQRGFKDYTEFNEIQDEWKNYIINIQKDEYIAPGLFETLSDILLNQSIESLERTLLREMEQYFTTHLGLNLETILERIL